MARKKKTVVVEKKKEKKAEIIEDKKKIRDVDPDELSDSLVELVDDANFPIQRYRWNTPFLRQERIPANTNLEIDLADAPTSGNKEDNQELYTPSNYQALQKDSYEDSRYPKIIDSNSQQSSFTTGLSQPFLNPNPMMQNQSDSYTNVAKDYQKTIEPQEKKPDKRRDW